MISQGIGSEKQNHKGALVTHWILLPLSIVLLLSAVLILSVALLYGLSLYRSTLVHLTAYPNLNILWCQGNLYSKPAGRRLERTLWKEQKNKEGRVTIYCTTIGYASARKSLFAVLAWNEGDRKLLQEMNPIDGRVLGREDMPNFGVAGIEPSPDGSFIVISGTGDQGEGIYLFDRKQRSVTLVAKCGIYSHSFWDASGREFVFSKKDAAGKALIYRYSLASEGGHASLKAISSGLCPVTLRRPGAFIYYDKLSQRLVLHEGDHIKTLPLRGELLGPAFNGLARVYGTDDILVFKYLYWGFETYLVAGPSYSSSRMILPDVGANHVLVFKAAK